MATAVILYVRFTRGLGAVTNLSQSFPWGIWKGFNVVAGVALAGGAYVVTFMVYILGLEKYRPIVRVTVLNGFLAYLFYAGALLLELGRPWEVMNPIIGYSFGLSSVLFLVAWHFLLYITAQAIEFSPAVAEWLGFRRIHRLLAGMTVGAVIFGITLSTLHQSGLGALFLMAKTKIHPLWYSETIPILFFVSSIFAGLGMVIFEGSVSRRVFYDRIDPEHAKSHEGIVIGLARIAGAVMFVYLFLQAVNFLHGQLWRYFSGALGAWYLVEVVGLVGRPHGAAAGRFGASPLGTHPARRRAGRDRRGPQPVERLVDRLRMAGAGPLCAHLDGNRRDRRGHLHRDLGLPLGRAAHAGFQRPARMGETPGTRGDVPRGVREPDGMRRLAAAVERLPTANKHESPSNRGARREEERRISMDPFPTKGIEYLLMIGYLLMLVPFAWLLSRIARAWTPAREPAVASPAMESKRQWFQLPDGFHLHRGHTWAFAEGGELLRVGIDDFAQRLIGEPTALLLPQPGQSLEQGQRGWQLRVNGDTVDLLSPVQGEVVEVNEEAVRTPSLVAEDPYGRGWLLKVRAGRQGTGLKNLLPRRLAHAWIDEAKEQLNAMLGGNLGPVLQDGGLPMPGAARELAGDRWPEIAAKLLLTK